MEQQAVLSEQSVREHIQLKLRQLVVILVSLLIMHIRLFVLNIRLHNQWEVQQLQRLMDILKTIFIR